VEQLPPDGGNSELFMSTLDPRAVKTVFDIFVGGPMGGEEKDGGGLFIKDHLGSLLKAVSNIAREMNEEARAISGMDYDFVSVSGPPPAGPGYIPDKVFDLLDKSDLGIFDMSGAVYTTEDGKAVWTRASPNVIYEYAFLHGLGVPTLPVAVEGHPIEFYFNQSSRLTVKRFTVAQLQKILRDPIKAAVNGRGNEIFRQNPISKFYDGISLVDISSTMGLANGYYFNFLRHATNHQNSVFDQLNTTGHGHLGLKKLVILKPESMSELQQLRRRLSEQVKDIGLELNTLKEDASQVGSRRPFNFDHVGQYIVDILMPIGAMAVSPRYEKNLKLMIEMKDFGGDEYRRRVEKFEADVIRSFVGFIEKFVKKENTTNSDLFTILTLPEFIDILKAEHARP
jgi:hypothetical protein